MKLSKKAVLAAHDDIQANIPFKPELNTKLSGDELYQALHTKVVELEIDEDDRADLKPETCEVLDALIAQFSVEEEESEVEDAKVVEEPKKGKKDKKSKKEAVPEPEPVKESKKDKKGKKEKVVEEPVVESPKEKKSKKGKVDPIALSEQLKGDKKINRDGLYAVVNDNPDLFGADAAILLTITNPMVLKKQIRNVLEGGKVEQTVTKKPTAKAKEEKAPKSDKKAEAAPSLRETVEALDDLDTLKELAKANKDAFPGVKAKKFDKAKKLRKAMLEVLVEAKSAKADKKAKSEKKGVDRQTVIDWMTARIDKAGGKIAKLQLKTEALEVFPENEKNIRDDLSYGKNPAYNKFKELLSEDDGIIGWASKMKGGKPEKSEKKDKKEVAPEPVKEAKADKKGKKKDKKKGKKNKK